MNKFDKFFISFISVAFAVLILLILPVVMLSIIESWQSLFVALGI